MRISPLLSIRQLEVIFRLGRRRRIQAVSGVSLDIPVGETLGLVGESGCGKSTIARTIVRLQKATAGRILFGGVDLVACKERQLRKLRPHLQMIFQDATASLNPGRKIGRTIEEPLRVLGRADRRERPKSVDWRLTAASSGDAVPGWRNRRITSLRFCAEAGRTEANTPILGHEIRHRVKERRRSQA